MHIRVVRLNVRNPIVGAALLIAALGFLLAVAVFGFALLVGGIAVGTVVLLTRRVLRSLRGHSPTLEPLDATREVFPGARAGEPLPPGDRQ